MDLSHTPCIYCPNELEFYNGGWTQTTRLTDQPMAKQSLTTDHFNTILAKHSTDRETDGQTKWHISITHHTDMLKNEKWQNFMTPLCSFSYPGCYF